jgi:uncharacterized protein (DUF2237 family)
MKEWTCHICGEPADYRDPTGCYCATHWDEALNCGLGPRVDYPGAVTIQEIYDSKRT